MAEIFHHAWAIGWGDDEIGEAAIYGAFALFELKPDDIEHLDKISQEVTGEPLTDEEKDIIGQSAGAIIREDADGFVSLEFYDTKQQLENAWREIEDAYTKWYEEHEDDVW